MSETWIETDARGRSVVWWTARCDDPKPGMVLACEMSESHPGKWVNGVPPAMVLGCPWGGAHQHTLERCTKETHDALNLPNSFGVAPGPDSPI